MQTNESIDSKERSTWQMESPWQKRKPTLEPNGEMPESCVIAGTGTVAAPASSSSLDSMAKEPPTPTPPSTPTTLSPNLPEVTTAPTEPSAGSKMAACLRRRVRTCCTVSTLKSCVPVVEWLPKYRLGYIQNDIVAGITVALTVIPQGMAYANLAGLPLQYGLYTSFMGLFTYCIFGSMRMIHVGPTSMMAILILDHVLVGGPAYAVWLSFLSGCVEVLLGVFRLGTLVDFISLPVASGFSSAASVIVVANLLKSIFGLKFSSSSFIELVYKLVIYLPETNYWDLILGMCCLFSLIVLKKLNETLKTLGPEITSRCQKGLMSFVWFLLTARNALVVVLASIAAFFIVEYGNAFLTLSAGMKPGLPEFAFPPLTVEKGDQTLGVVEICKDLGWGIILVPLVAILQHIAIAKSFSQGKPVDATQEVVALGLCNIFGSFVSAFPVTASFSRTALNVSSGIKTTMAGVFSGSLVLVALSVLAPTFRYIPKATLAAVIINAVVSMIEYEMIPRLWRTNKSDLAVWLITFFGCLLLEAEYGIILGIFCSLIVLLYYTGKPRVSVEIRRLNEEEVVVVAPDRALHFPAVEYARSKVNQFSKVNQPLPIIFDGRHMCGADYTTAQGIKMLIEDFRKKDRVLVFTNLTDDVLDVIKSINPPNFVHCKSDEEIRDAIQARYSQTDKSVKSSDNDSGADVELGDELSVADVPTDLQMQRHIRHPPPLRMLSSESAVLLLGSPNSPTSPDPATATAMTRFHV